MAKLLTEAIKDYVEARVEQATAAPGTADPLQTAYMAERLEIAMSAVFGKGAND